jgi:hypothetical protein
VTAVGLVSLYGFVTFEQTAITTVPPAETVVAFIPATPTPTPIPTPTPPPTATPVGGAEVASVSNTVAPLISHPIEGREDCLECHTSSGALAFPPNHEAFPVSTCTVCHSTQQENPAPPPVEHKIEGREDCLKCHELDTLPESHQIGEFTSATCLLCHAPDQEEAVAEAETVVEHAEAAAVPVGEVSFANDILPLLEDKCATCHSEIAMGDLNVTSYEAVAKGGANGPAFVPGSPDESLIVQTMQGKHLGTLEEPDLQKLIAWIAAGAANN